MLVRIIILDNHLLRCNDKSMITSKIFSLKVQRFGYYTLYIMMYSAK